MTAGRDVTEPKCESRSKQETRASSLRTLHGFCIQIYPPLVVTRLAVKDEVSKCGMAKMNVLDPPEEGLNLFTRFGHRHEKW